MTNFGAATLGGSLKMGPLTMKHFESLQAKQIYFPGEVILKKIKHEKFRGDTFRGSPQKSKVYST